MIDEVEKLICSACHKVKPVTDFARSSAAREGARQGYHSYCKQCFSLKYRPRLPVVDYVNVSEKVCSQCKETKGAGEFNSTMYSTTGLRSACRVCERARHRREAKKKAEKEQGNEQQRAN